MICLMPAGPHKYCDGCRLCIISLPAAESSLSRNRRLGLKKSSPEPWALAGISPVWEGYGTSWLVYYMYVEWAKWMGGGLVVPLWVRKVCLSFYNSYCSVRFTGASCDPHGIDWHPTVREDRTLCRQSVKDWFMRLGLFLVLVDAPMPLSGWWEQCQCCQNVAKCVCFMYNIDFKKNIYDHWKMEMSGKVYFNSWFVEYIL